jgi:hypothetical protein
VTLEPAITVFADELRERHGTRPLIEEEFDARPRPGSSRPSAPSAHP